MGKLWGAAGLAGLSLLMFYGFMRAEFTGVGGQVVAFLVTVGGPALGAGLLFRSYFRGRQLGGAAREKIRAQTYRSEILRLAARKGGKLTVPEVVTELVIDSATADAALKALHLEELAELEITDSGMIVYEFPDIRRLAEGEKDSAKGILDD